MDGDDARDGREAGAKAPAEGDLSTRLQRLETQLDQRRPASDRAARPGAGPADVKGIGNAFRMSSEFVAGVIVGGGLGWLLDRWFGTSPWGLIVFLMLGFAAGVVNVLRAAGGLSQPGGRTRAVDGRAPDHRDAGPGGRDHR